MPVEVAMPGCGGARLVVIALSLKRPGRFRRKASWRSGYAEDCKSLHPGSIPGEASTPNSFSAPDDGYRRRVVAAGSTVLRFPAGSNTSRG